MTRTVAFGLALALSTTPSFAAEPQPPAKSNDVAVEKLPSSLHALFGFSMPEAARKVRKARVLDTATFDMPASISVLSTAFTRTVAESSEPPGYEQNPNNDPSCVNVPVFGSDAYGPTGATVLTVRIPPSLNSSLVKIDFTTSLNLGASGVAFNGDERDGIALVCRVWKEYNLTPAEPRACPGTGFFPFLISQVSGYNGLVRNWAGHIGQGAYSGLFDISTLPNPSGWLDPPNPNLPAAQPAEVVVQIQVMKAFNQGAAVSGACHSNLVVQTY